MWGGGGGGEESSVNTEVRGTQEQTGLCRSKPDVFTENIAMYRIQASY